MTAHDLKTALDVVTPILNALSEGERATFLSPDVTPESAYAAALRLQAFDTLRVRLVADHKRARRET